MNYTNVAVYAHSQCIILLPWLYRYPDHEHSVGKIAKEMGFNHVSLSSLVMPMVRIVPRGFTGTCMYMYCMLYLMIVRGTLHVFEHFQHVLMHILPLALKDMLEDLLPDSRILYVHTLMS